MKRILHVIIMSAVLILTSSRCEKDDTPDENNYASFRSYFSCYINGEYFEPKGKFGCHRMSVTYYENNYYNLGEGFLRINGQNCHAEIGDYRVVGIVLNGVFEKDIPKIIRLTEDSIHNVFASAIQDSAQTSGYTLKNIISGEVAIDKLVPHVTGESNGVVIGTFEFTVHNNYGDTARVTNGKFGMKLPNP